MIVKTWYDIGKNKRTDLNYSFSSRRKGDGFVAELADELYDAADE